MTQKEIDDAKFSFYNAIADAFRNIQVLSNVSDPNDESKVKQTMLKIKDNLSNVDRFYKEIEALEYEVPDPEDEEEGYNFLLNGMK